MKKHALRLTLISLVTLSAFSACKKDKDEPTAESFVGTYKISDITMKAAGEEQSVFEGFATCSKDDTYELKADLSLVATDAGVQCEVSGSQTGSWKYENKKLIISGIESELDGNFEIVKHSGSELVLSESFSEGGMTISVLLYLKKQ